MKSLEFENNFSNWIVYQILSFSNLNQRSKMIDWFLEVIIHLFDLKNYHSILSIYFAFFSHSILRLNSTWRLVCFFNFYFIFFVLLFYYLFLLLFYFYFIF